MTRCIFFWFTSRWCYNLGQLISGSLRYTMDFGICLLLDPGNQTGIACFRVPLKDECDKTRLLDISLYGPVKNIMNFVKALTQFLFNYMQVYKQL